MKFNLQSYESIVFTKTWQEDKVADIDSSGLLRKVSIQST
jgi:hypothetical protein